MIFYFSGTGNSRWVAESLSNLLSDDRCVNIAEAMFQDTRQYNIDADERIGIVFPVYGWDVPEIVARFISDVQFEGSKNLHYLYFVATCGDDTGCTLQKFNKLIKKRGWKLQSAFAVQMPNTYVCLPGFDVDDDALEQRKLSLSNEKVENIAHQILNEVHGLFNTLPGKFPEFKTHILGYLFKRYLMNDKPFNIDETACTECGRCVSVCPVGNIKIEHGAPVWHGNCTSCLACYHHCPQHAVHYGRQTRNKGQYVCNKSRMVKA